MMYFYVASYVKLIAYLCDCKQGLIIRDNKRKFIPGAAAAVYLGSEPHFLSLTQNSLMQKIHV